MNRNISMILWDTEVKDLQVHVTKTKIICYKRIRKSCNSSEEVELFSNWEVSGKTIKADEHYE